MLQLVAHILIFLLAYRSCKIFFYEWNGWHVFLFGWGILLNAAGAMAASEFWYLEGEKEDSSYFLFFIIMSWIILITFMLATVGPVYTVAHTHFTEWTWGTLHWVTKEIILRQAIKLTTNWLLYNIRKDWFNAQIRADNEAGDKNALLFLTVRSIMIFMWFLTCIGLYDWYTWDIILCNWVIKYEYSSWKIYNLLIEFYIVFVIVKSYVLYVYWYINGGQKHMGIIYKHRLIFMRSREWLFHDELNRNRRVPFETIINDRQEKYELPLYWKSWQQTVIDNIPYIFRRSYFYRSKQIKHTIFLCDKFAEIKTTRFEEFTYEILGGRMLEDYYNGYWR